MSRIKLRYGGKTRHKALLGADGAVMAAATLAAAGMTTAATAAAAKSQAKAMVDSAKTQAQSIDNQTTNNNNLQKEQLAFTRSQNQENRQQQQDIQATLQIMAGQSNVNDRMERNKMQVRLGGRPKYRTISQPFYGGEQFQVTDGGGVLPIATSPEGYGLYELYGNDHEHYHKTSGGKNKTGVGIKFKDGSIVEGEGNQNSNQGELLYVTPNDAMFISKHSIAGFNPTKAVMNGVRPEEAFAIQETLKNMKGLADNGSKTTKRNVKYIYGGLTPALMQADMTQNPNNGTAPTAAAMAYATRDNFNPPVERLNYDNAIAKRGGRIRLKCGGRRKASWGDYKGATFNAAGNLLGAGVSTIGNLWAANKLSKAYNQAGGILADAYSRMKGIDMSELKMEDYAAPHTLAVIRDANTNINPQLERIRRNAISESREINRGTLSSAARQQRLAATNDRMFQRMGEQYAAKANIDEQIKQGNAERITQVAQENANRDVQARKDYSAQRLSLLQYNNDIENAKIAGMAQARADALTQSSLVKSQGLQSSLTGIGNAINASGNAFASAYDTARKMKAESAYALLGMNDVDRTNYVIANNDEEGAKAIFANTLSQLTRLPVDNSERAVLIDNLNKIKSKFPKIIGTIPTK